MGKWKFCKSANVWWLCIRELAQYFEYKDKIDGLYGRYNVKFSTEATVEEKQKKYSEVARAYALDHERIKKVSATESILVKQAGYLLEGKELWFNEKGGYNLGMAVDEELYRDAMLFPHYSMSDVQVTQWDGDVAPYYTAKVGDIEVSTGIGAAKVTNWATYQEAYIESLKYVTCETKEVM